MIKQLVAFAVAAGFSMSAWADFIQYDLKNVTFYGGDTLDGSIVQDTRDKSIAYYYFQEKGSITDDLNAARVPGTHRILSAESLIYNGPTSFTFEDTGQGQYLHKIRLYFYWDYPHSPDRTIVVGGDDSITPADPGDPAVYRQITGGTVVVGQVGPDLLDSLWSGKTYVNRVSPIPEPGSFALLAVGVGAALMRRRRG